jgi:hypothetical protein
MKQKSIYLEGRQSFSELILTKNRLQNATLNRVQAETSLQVLRAALLSDGAEQSSLDPSHLPDSMNKHKFILGLDP